ncbi:type VII secretion protein EccB [Streptomyces daliensis]|uniref:Type VII secretion protein EccB n=1 Tax=Streptomyces daliensis TaxID=299421 RepID=A0A8T4ISJ4_9ACTN|nr:type VII secretion protein EccB [Streptomyces daliensis]
MASRRDELNAYTFAKKRLVAQFLQPSPTGTEEGAPRPVRAVVPGMVIAVVILAGFGAWGMFKPTAPKGWDTAKEKVIIGSDSTTRYVVLKTNGKKQLHPVLNLASAKLLLDPSKGQVVKVDEKILDSGKLPHGATIGIPYAPDRLPDKAEAESEKTWAVCERPGGSTRAVQKAAFVFADREKDKVEGKNRLRGGELMYVEGPGDKLYVVDKAGKKYPIENDQKLLGAVVGVNKKPQRVSGQWLATLKTGDPIFFPEVGGTPNDPANVPGGQLDDQTNRVGAVLKARSSGQMHYYVVVRGGVMPVSDFTAQLLLSSEQLLDLGQNGEATQVSFGAFSPTEKEFGGTEDWPREQSTSVNPENADTDGRNTFCNVLRDVGEKGGATLSTWAGESFPATLPTGSTSAYVTPGSGQLFRQIQGTAAKDGGLFLVTDTGLRYAMQTNDDTDKDESEIGSDGKKESAEEKARKQQEGGAPARLGYAEVTPAPIPAAWSQFLPTGPRLSTGSAKQPQGS